MNPLAWITTLIAAQELEVSPELYQIIRFGIQDQKLFYFLNKSQSEEITETMNMMYSSYSIVAFGNRLDRDGFICLVVADCAYPKGSVVVMNWYGRPEREVGESYPSLAAWAKTAENEHLQWKQSQSDL